ncbi:hypothetical protein [Helicobacter cetorum]|uniref:Uncharacterized protein n=1 Tax=Helicobacter cetorum (strain ATCC BAA-429 / MIT 00-7128) TaxID=182217 RepID=I0EKM9_HELC0|nr:hypothetical protein [Helicobacter cetorum]AFI03498.1 hypothetical protein HCW_01025 [Helicobacter cetorum MIT 00-7128]
MQDSAKKLEYEERFNDALLKLQACQDEKQVTSCLKCEQVLNCEIRNNYVNATYESMSLGEVGGFDFN